MSVKIRMTRIGRRHRPFFRINAIDSRTPRDGRIIEKLGHYDPLEKDKEKQVVLKLDRIKHWLDNGAIPSDSVAQILLRQGIKTKYLEEKQARRAKARELARRKDRFFTKADKIAAEKAASKAEEQAKAKAEKTQAETKAAEEKAKADAEAQAKTEAEEQTEEVAEQAEAKPEAAEKAATTTEQAEEKPEDKEQ